ncbi:MAG TPA: S8 family serine peptidase, partial [Ardenticatenaceae bacterium]
MRRSRFAACLAVLLLAIAAALTAHRGVAANSAALSEQSHKVLAAPGQLDTSAPGVRLLHDYGAFALYSVSDEALSGLRGVRVADEMDVLLFDGQPIYTRDERRNAPEANSQAAPQGPALHLIQFVGPIKPEWLDAVEAAGARLVHYVANNGYLVWADDAARARLDLLAGNSDFLQYSAPYRAELKLGASLRDVAAIESGEKPEPQSEERVTVTIQMVEHSGSAASEGVIRRLSTRLLSDWTPVLEYRNATVEVRASDIADIAALSDVYWIGEYTEPELLDEVQGQILAGNLNAAQSGPSGPGYREWLDSYGFSQNPDDYPIVDITDDGIGNGSVNSGDPTLHESGVITNTTRVAFINNCTAEAHSGSVGGHGHINASIAIGFDTRAGVPYRDENGFQRGLGINPYGLVAGTKIFNANGGYDDSACGSNYPTLIARSYNAGARISSNSWGCRSLDGDCIGVYSPASQIYDAATRDADPSMPGNQQFITIFSSGNEGRSGVTPPGNGKNMITVGASESYRPNQAGALANNAMQVAEFSSRGPAPGGRVKPEVIAPGTFIQGTASTHPAYTGGTVNFPYAPVGQRIFAASSGTSHSTPAVAGVASLYYWWLENTYSLSEPSPAMMKAYLAAHPTYLTGTNANDTLPSNAQGYGMPNMTAALDDAERFLLDQSVRLDGAGQTWSFDGRVADPTRPLRIVLAYTDAPGAVGTSPQVNDLSLAAEVDGTSYLGNRFSGQWSTPGGEADTKNNYEAIFLPPGTSGAVKLTITAFNVAGDGVPGIGDGTDQDFALVCYNCLQNPDFTLEASPDTQAICVPDEADYTVQVGSIQGFDAPVTLSANGNPAGTTATFSENPVKPPGSSVLKVTSGGLAVAGRYNLDVVGVAPTRTHTVTLGLDLFTASPGQPALVSPANGATEQSTMPTFSWTAASQAASYTVEIATDAAFTEVVVSASGVMSTTFTPVSVLEPRTRYYWRVRATNGCGASSYSQTFTFSTITPPDACPAGESAQVHFYNGFESGAAGWTHSGVMDTWTVTNTKVYSGALAWRAQDVPQVSDQRLVSPPITLPSDRSRLTLQFWNHQTFEDRTQNSCWDGAILEVSTDGGQNFNQIYDGLLTDPYDGFINASHGNPLGNVSAWCGDPQDWLKSVVALDEYAGQTIRFRFRVGTDDAMGRLPHGWYIDEVAVQSCPAVVTTPTPTATATQTATPTATSTATATPSPTATATASPSPSVTPSTRSLFLPL